MKIVVIGGTGLIGSKTVAILRQGGHEVVAGSPKSGINSVTGEGVKEGRAREIVAEPMVCGLTAGGKWIRTFGPFRSMGGWVAPPNVKTSGREIEGRSLETKASLARNRRFESISLQRRVRCEPVSGGNSPSYVEKPRFSAGVRPGQSGAVE